MTKKTELNNNQEKAVDTTKGAYLVLAGAGSGKTRVITERILRLVEKGLAQPNEILSITFTNKAAQEMKERAINLLREKGFVENNEQDRLPIISTFHSLGVRILKEEGKRLGLPKRFSIYDKSDSIKIIKDVLKNKGMDTKENPPQKFLSFVSKKKGEGLSVENSGLLENRFEKNLVSIWSEYQKRLARENALDFGDLLQKPYDLLLKNNDLRRKYSEKFRFIQIDEYQDTNRVQYLMVKLLSEAHGNVFAVGDADQNIFSWRGARLENILNFQNDFKNAQLINLAINYRSTKKIVELAETIIKKNTLRIPKEVETINPEGETPGIFVAENEKLEARFLAETIKERIKNRTPASEIAVLYRTHFQSRAIEEELLKENIPYQVLGVKFFERKEVKDVLSYVETALNKKSLTHLKRIINNPPRGIGKVTLLKILSGKEDSLNASMQSKLKSFYELLDKIEKISFQLPPSEVIRFVIEKTGLKTHYEETGDDRERVLNMEELVNMAQKYDSGNPRESLEKFLEEVSIDLDENVSEESSTETVKLLTVHSAKGLEFDLVFVTGLEDGLFPIVRDGDTEETEEERRLFYVAVTRAIKKLMLTYSVTRRIYGRQELNQPSEFLIDIERLLEPIAAIHHETTNYIEI